MSSPHEQNTMIGDLMLRRSTRRPLELRSSPEVSLLPTKSWSAIDCISSEFSSTGLPHHFSNSRKRGASVSIFEYRLKIFFQYVLSGCSASKFATRLAPSKMPLPRSPAREVSQ